MQPETVKIPVPEDYPMDAHQIVAFSRRLGFPLLMVSADREVLLDCEWLSPAEIDRYRRHLTMLLQ
ncbi:hypothetical protein HYZ99_02170 [Candidatus Peregrinibacteria bacterium]|nr:hypothetical protein [Candidatus Peregrinibacteria bacterium]